ncbi:MAG: FAD-binding oxidoreductase [Clostridia bacterium]
MSHYKDYMPPYHLDVAPKDSYRSVYRWGDPTFNKIPKEGLYKLIKKTFNLTDDDFKKPAEMGLEKVDFDIPRTLTDLQVNEFKAIVGKENVGEDCYSRITASYGKTMLDMLRLRKGIVENVPDIVLYPSTTEEIVKIVDICKRDKISIYVCSGGSSVTRGFEAMKKGAICLDFRRNFNKMVKFNEVNQTITVQSGMTGPNLEKLLNNAPSTLGAKCRYTCGHFPQSFEFSSVGGWAITRGAGQNSTYYGKMEDLVICQKYVTPVGIIETDPVPRKACGPSIDQIMMGSEGAFGILCEVTIKLFHFHPEDRQRFCYIFKSFEEGQKAMREVMQGEFGVPSAFRLSDEEETSFMLHLYGVEEGGLNGLLSTFGYKPMQRCLMIGFNDGDIGLQKLINRRVHRIVKRHGAMRMPSVVTSEWEKGRFNDPYMRDCIQDFGIIIDTLELAVDWDRMPEVYKSVRAFCKSRPNTIVTTHISHCYQQGANLYFIFSINTRDIKEFSDYHSGILDAIQKSGACMSHHHGIGKLFAPWLEGQLGKNEYEILKTLKKHFDPDNLMNPGGTIGLDMPKDKIIAKDEKFKPSANVDYIHNYIDK